LTTDQSRPSSQRYLFAVDKFNSDKYPNIGELEPYASDSPNASQGDPAGPLGGLSWILSAYWAST